MFINEMRAIQNKRLSGICVFTNLVFQLLHLLMLSQTLQLYMSFFEVTSIFAVRTTSHLIYFDFESQNLLLR